MDLKESDILGEEISAHWYYRAKAAASVRLIGPQAPRSVLDVGAGSGFFSKHLLANTAVAEAMCVDVGYPADRDTTHAGKPLRFRSSISKAEVELVLMMDVLEHVDDELKLLHEYINAVPQGTRFLVSVPAFMFLWSAHDEFLEHRRRYTLGQLELLLTQAGLVTEHSTYFFAGVFPIAVAMRLAGRLRPRGRRAQGSQLKQHNRLVNWVLAGICLAELPLLKINRLAGLTAFCVARRP